MDPTEAPSSAPTPRRSTASALIALARPHQWTKSAFVFIGPFYGLADLAIPALDALWITLLAAGAFALASSGCYVINDLADAEEDRRHPRKRRRPIAAGEVSPTLAAAWSLTLFAGAAAIVLLMPSAAPEAAPRALLGVTLGVYVANVLLYSAYLKTVAIADVMSLALGFVLRVLGGCAALAISPTGWLLNIAFFLSMFLAFSKRLGERRTLGEQAGAARAVQGDYTDVLLRMSVVVTAVATLLGYTVYVEEQSLTYTWGFNLFWLTILPATFGLFRAIVLIERGSFDDPTEMALRDRPFQAAALCFVLLTGALMWLFRLHGVG